MLTPYTDNQRQIPVEGSTIETILRTLTTKYEKLGRELMRPGGGGRKDNVSIYLNSRDIRTLEDEQTKVQDGDVVTIVPSVGCGFA